MDKKRKILIFIIVIVLIILMSFFIFRKNKSIKTKSKILDNSNKTAEIKTDYDGVNKVYTIYDKETNEIITTTNDIGDLKRYEDNPDYNPNPLY